MVDFKIKVLLNQHTFQCPFGSTLWEKKLKTLEFS